MKRQPRFIKNCCWKVANTKQSMSTLLSATTKWSTSMSHSKFYQVIKPLILKAFSLLTLRLVITTKSILVKMQSKP